MKELIMERTFSKEELLKYLRWHVDFIETNDMWNKSADGRDGCRKKVEYLINEIEHNDSSSNEYSFKITKVKEGNKTDYHYTIAEV